MAVDPRVATVRCALTLASRVCRRVADSASDIRSHIKDDRSPVTVADFASQAIVARVLREKAGALSLVAEESAEGFRGTEAAYQTAVLEALRPDWPGVALEEVFDLLAAGATEPERTAFWTLDPIDGTKGFLRRQQYAIALAWIEDGQPVAGGVASPNLSPRPGSGPDRASDGGSIYIAVRGHGVLGGPSDDAEVELRPLQRRAPSDTFTLCAPVETAHADAFGTARLVARLGGEALRVDSQCKYLLVARGDADAYLRLPKGDTYVERIWDHAAGALVATEAGCVVSDLDGRALDFSRGRVLSANRGLLCASPFWHPLVMDALRNE